jgi:hypothetical protein
VWSKGKIIAARKAPMTFKQGFSRDAFDFESPFELFFGNSHFRDVRCVVRTSDGTPWLRIDPAETAEAPPRLSAKFFGPTGLPELEIIENEWRCLTGVWDLKISGPVIEVRTEGPELILRLRALPPHGLEIQYLRMFLNDNGIFIDSAGCVTLRSGGAEINMTGSEVSGADAVFSLP